MDLVLSNTPEAVNTVNASPIPRFNTDHHLVSFLLSTHVRISSAASKTQYAIDYSKLDSLSLVDNLSNYDFAGILSCLDVEDIWNQLSSILKEAVCPHSQAQSQENLPHVVCFNNETDISSLEFARLERKQGSTKCLITSIN